MTTRLPAMALALALCAAGAATAAEPPAGVVQSYALGIGDTVAVTVFGRADLTGQFPIGPDSAIRLPLLGPVPAAGRTRQELAEDIHQQLGKVLAYDAQVTVDVALYQPVYVIGDVVRPGEQVFLAGLTALKAYARAGGTPTVFQTQNSNGQATATATAERDLRLAQTDLFAWALRRAGLDAALSGSERIQLPPELEPLKETPLITELLARETALLISDRQALATARTLGERQKDQLDLEIEALQGEKKALAEQHKFIEAELGNMETLQKKGLTTNQRLIDMQQLKSGLQADEHRLTSFMSRARQSQVSIEINLQQQSDGWRRERQLARITAASEVERARARMEGARLQLAALGQVSAADIALGRTQLSFQVTRAGPGGVQIINADGHTPLLPGDVLEVHLRAVDETPASRSTLLPPPEIPRSPAGGVDRRALTAG